MCARLFFLCTVCVAAAGTLKRRRGDAWSISSENWRSEYYARETHTISVLEEKGVVIDEAKAVQRHKKAKAAVAASHATFDIDDEGDMFEYDETNQKLGDGLSLSRYNTIAFFERTYGAPPKKRVGRKGRCSPQDNEPRGRVRGLEGFGLKGL